MAFRYGVRALVAAAVGATLLTAAPVGTGATHATGISYSITQQGPPALQRALFGTSTTKGSGLLKPVALGGNANVRGGRIIHTDSRGSLRLVMQATGAREVRTPGERNLTFRVDVTESNDPRCPPGKSGLLIVSDRIDGTDQIHIGVCGHLHAYSNGIEGTVSVRIATVTLPNPARERAIALVRAILKKNAARCELRVLGVAARKIPNGWRVSARVTTFGNAGTAEWNVIARRVAAAEPLAADIAKGCP
jgi:hypothetical protein